MRNERRRGRLHSVVPFSAPIVPVAIVRCRYTQKGHYHSEAVKLIYGLLRRRQQNMPKSLWRPFPLSCFVVTASYSGSAVLNE